ncbi:hypothetical protein BpHYR1_035234 [Brachionus plicatilis]|uniref:Uncharacterized protein n=1 Tax=Brachionus plicatilis TaxID=10195 RepID=A0A3M7T9P7_BRAPC|nr:hypothetical protein BpHYR1_035234 [Brachionus plicatilis]
MPTRNREKSQKVYKNYIQLISNSFQIRREDKNFCFIQKKIKNLSNYYISISFAKKNFNIDFSVVKPNKI